MNSVTVTIKTDNAAFEPNPGPEVARILRRLADQCGEGIQPGSDSYELKDVNGNRVGFCEFG